MSGIPRQWKQHRELAEFAVWIGKALIATVMGVGGLIGSGWSLHQMILKDVDARVEAALSVVAVKFEETQRHMDRLERQIEERKPASKPRAIGMTSVAGQ